MTNGYNSGYLAGLAKGCQRRAARAAKKAGDETLSREDRIIGCRCHYQLEGEADGLLGKMATSVPDDYLRDYMRGHEYGAKRRKTITKG